MLLQCIADFCLGLAHTCVGTEGGITSGVDDSPQLAAGDDIKANTLLSHEIEDSLVGAGFDRKGYMGIQRSKGCAKLGQIFGDGLLAVDKSRGADSFGDVCQVDIFTVQGTVLVGERMHVGGIMVSL